MSLLLLGYRLPKPFLRCHKDSGKVYAGMGPPLVSPLPVWADTVNKNNCSKFILLYSLFLLCGLAIAGGGNE